MANRKAHGDASQTRRQLLEAAGELVLTHGVHGLTLDAVARAAGVSKGGLLYHFPSKEALISAMLDVWFDEFDQEIAGRMAATDAPQAPGAWTRAYWAATLADCHESPSLSLSMFAAINENPVLAARVRQRFDTWQARAINDGLDPALGTLIRLVVDGLYFTNVLQLGIVPPALAQQVGSILEQLSRQGHADQGVSS